MEGKDEATIVQSLHQLGYIPIRIFSTQAKGTGFPFFLYFAPACWNQRPLHIYSRTLHTYLRRLASGPESQYLGNPDRKSEIETGAQRCGQEDRRRKLAFGGFGKLSQDLS